MTTSNEADQSDMMDSGTVRSGADQWDRPASGTSEVMDYSKEWAFDMDFGWLRTAILR